MIRKKLRIYLEIIANLMMIIRNKDAKIYRLEETIRELKRTEGVDTNFFH